MSRRHVIMILFLGLISGLIATVAASRYMSKVRPSVAVNAPPPKLDPVVIAKVNVDKGVKLKKVDLEISKWPPPLVPPSAIRNIKVAVNRVTLMRLTKGEPLLASKLAPVGSSPGLASFISPGMRGVTVRVNDVIGVAGFLLPGSRVDVLTTLDVTRQTDESDTRARRKKITLTKVVLQDVEVLAIGSSIEDSGGGKKGRSKLAKSVSVVTLLVTPIQAESLTLASAQGQLLLALRNNLDKSPIQTPGVTASQLIFGGPPVVPLKKLKKSSKGDSTPSPQLPRRIEVIRGGKRARESLTLQPKVGGTKK